VTVTLWKKIKSQHDWFQNHHPPVSFGTAQARNLVLICLLLATCDFQTNKQIIHITCTYAFTKPFYTRKIFELMLQTPGLRPEHLNEKTVLFKFDLKTFSTIAHKTANCSCTAAHFCQQLRFAVLV